MDFGEETDALVHRALGDGREGVKRVAASGTDRGGVDFDSAVAVASSGDAMASSGDAVAVAVDDVSVGLSGGLLDHRRFRFFGQILVRGRIGGRHPHGSGAVVLRFMIGCAAHSDDE